MTKYAEEIADALEAIEEAGTTLPLTRHPMAVDTGAGEDDFDADFTDQTGAGQLDQPQEHTITAVVLPASNGRLGDLDTRLVTNELVLSHYRFLIIAASGLAVTPTYGDVISYQGRDWNLVASTAVEPDGVPIIFKAAIHSGG